MELINLLAPWFLTSIILALIYFIWDKDQDLYWERKEHSEQIQKILDQAEKERKDLYDRLMAGTLPQYKEHEAAPNEVNDETDADLIPLDEAKDELMGVDNGE